MRKARNYGEVISAILAIVVGLGMVGMSWADNPSQPWPVNTGPAPTAFKCNSSTSQWDCTGQFNGTDCVPKNSPNQTGQDFSLYECGDAVWNSVKATQIRQYGKCNYGSGSCTQWTSYNCVIWNVYKDKSCSIFACSWVGAYGPFCDPENPTGQ